MSFLSEASEDATSVAPEQAATGPRVGFLESWAVSWNEQTRAAAMYGIEDQMWKLDSEQTRAMRSAGIEDVPILSPDSVGFWADNMPGPAAGVERYLDVARYYVDGAEPGFATQLQDYDKRIEDLREKYPNLNLQTSREMWERVQSEAQRYEQQAVSNRRTLGGEIGAFIGGSLGALNPNTDPLNFLTLGVGGVGKSIIGRVATQGGAQGVIEGINQITGVQEQRRLLGLDYGLGDAVSRVAGAAIGGAAVQGVGEAIGVGLRRWFRSTPIDTALPPTPEVLERPALPDTRMVPPHAIPADGDLAAAKLTREPDTYIDYLHEQSPLSVTRAGRARTVLDLDYMTTRLDEWGGERPWEIAPKTDTALTPPRGDFVNVPDMTRFVEKSQIDEIARRVDPDTFRRYDELAQRKQTYTKWLDELSETRDAGVQQRIDDIDDKIYQIAAKADEVGGKRAAKLRKDIKALEAEKAQIVTESAAKETPDMARVRRELMRDDEKMRDLAPLVSRAYSRARNKWTNTAADRQAVMDMMREGRTDLRADPQAERIAAGAEQAVAETLMDRAPILRQADKVSGKIAKDADAGDVAQAIVAENLKVLDEALETYRASLDGLIGTEKNGEITLTNGQKLNLDRDKIFVPNEEGTGARQMTVRELLEENKMDEYELEAVGTCSLRKTS